jgi:hypothetical protein
LLKFKWFLRNLDENRETKKKVCVELNENCWKSTEITGNLTKVVGSSRNFMISLESSCSPHQHQLPHPSMNHPKQNSIKSAFPRELMATKVNLSSIYIVFLIPTHTIHQRLHASPHKFPFIPPIRNPQSRLNPRLSNEAQTAAHCSLCCVVSRKIT